ncbi:unnamed protein product [Rhizopus stolonifer]
MGNLVSTKLKYQQERVRNFSSQIESSSNASTFSSNQPKLPHEYVFPQTEAEAARQSSQHYILKHIFQGNFFAPVEPILSQPDSKTLDIGSGAQATWLTDMACDFSHCEFYGIDISEPVYFDQVDIIHRPINLHIETADLFEGLSHDSNTFDFVHQRLMYSVYPQDKIQWMFQEIIRVTKPNGWIELVEPDISPKRAGPLYTMFSNALKQLLYSRLGKNLKGKNLVGQMMDLGIKEIKSDYGSLPCCWGGYIGKLVYEVYIYIYIFMYIDEPPPQ